MSRILYLTALCIGSGSVLAQRAPEPSESQRRLSMHASLFRMHDYGKPLTSLQPDGRGVVEFTADFLNDYTQMSPGMSPRDAALHELEVFTSGSETILKGRAQGQRSAFTSRGVFIYSDWDFQVLNTFKNDSSVAANPGDLITVTRPGGAITQKGVAYIAHDKTFPDFIQGGSYILFLHYLPESGSFQAFSGQCYLLSSSAVSTLSDYQDRSTLAGFANSLDPARFATVVEEAVRETRKKQ